MKCKCLSYGGGCGKQAAIDGLCGYCAAGHKTLILKALARIVAAWDAMGELPLDADDFTRRVAEHKNAIEAARKLNG